MEREAKDVTVHDITAFVTAKARVSTHPILGKIENKSKGKPLNSKGRRDGLRASDFSTHGGKLPTKSKCPFCNADYLLSQSKNLFKHPSESDRT